MSFLYNFLNSCLTLCNNLRAKTFTCEIKHKKYETNEKSQVKKKLSSGSWAESENLPFFSP